METIIERCAGLDVHKDSIVACVRTTDEQGDDATLSDVLYDEFHCNYNPHRLGLTERQWLWKLDEYISEELSKMLKV